MMMTNDLKYAVYIFKYVITIISSSSLEDESCKIRDVLSTVLFGYTISEERILARG